MHRNLLKLLRTANGESCHVGAVFLDVRGFTTFAGVAESADAAMFLRRIYTRIMDDYFPEAAFFKPTGDGLLVIRSLPRDSEDVRGELSDVIARCAKLVHEFPTLCDDDVMINFEIPELLGVGVARGSATRLVSGEKSLDYSGRCLNLAARLMDLARPAGVVFYDKFGAGLLDDKIAATLNAESVYVRGIAEAEPIEVHCTTGVEIPPANKSPIAGSRLHYESARSYTVKEMETLGSQHLVPLSQQPRGDGQVSVHVEHQMIGTGGRRVDGYSSVSRYSARVLQQPEGPHAAIDLSRIAKAARKVGMKSTWSVSVQVFYPE